MTEVALWFLALAALLILSPILLLAGYGLLWAGLYLLVFLMNLSHRVRAWFS